MIYLRHIPITYTGAGATEWELPWGAAVRLLGMKYYTSDYGTGIVVTYDADDESERLLVEQFWKEATPITDRPGTVVTLRPPSTSATPDPPPTV